MSFTTIAATAVSSTNTAGANHVITLPSGIASGDLILICMNIGSTAATLNAHADYTELLDENLANGLKVLYRWADGSETNPTLVSSASTRDATATLLIRGAETTIAPQIGTTASGSGSTPDPPASASLSSTKDYLFVTFCGSAGEQANDGSYCTSFPTDYTLANLTRTCGTVGTNLGGMIALAARHLTTGTAQNPGTFTVSESGGWRAQTIVVHPLTNPNIAASTATATGSANSVRSHEELIAAFTDDVHARSTATARNVAVRNAILNANVDEVWLGGDLCDSTAADYTAGTYGYDTVFGTDLNSKSYPVPGNHDADDMAGYHTYFDSRTPGGTLMVANGTTWYARSEFVGSTEWRLYFLSNGLDGGQAESIAAASAQYNWLSADLDAHSTAAMVVVVHGGAWGSYNSTGYTTTDLLGYFQDALTLLVDHGADILLCGHLHMYVRWPKMNHDGTTLSTGIRQFTGPTSSQSSNTYSEAVPPMPASNVKPEAHNANADYNLDEGYIKFTLYSDHYTWAYYVVTDAGASTLTDSGTETLNNVAAGTNVDATAATASAAGQNAGVSDDVAATEATATGAAYNATVTTGGDTSVNATEATATATGQDAGTSDSVAAVEATASAAAQAAGTSASVAAIEATVSAAAQAAGISDTVAATEATATGTGYAATTTVDAAPSAATATGTSYDAGVSDTCVATEATASGAAYNATVSTESLTNVDATAATATGTAYDAGTSDTCAAIEATVSGAAYAATSMVDSAPSAATATGIGYDTTLTTEFAATEATASGAAYNATVSVSGQTDVPATEATASGVAYDAGVSTTIAATEATASATGQVATTTVEVAPPASAATGAAYDATITTEYAATEATATATVTDATVSTSSQSNAQAVEATASASAYDPSVTATGSVDATTATATAAGQNAATDLASGGTEATASAAAWDVGASDSVAATDGSAAGVAYAAGVSTDVAAVTATATVDASGSSATGANFTDAPASAALADAVASDAGVATVVGATEATGTGTGFAAMAAVDVSPAVGAGTGTAYDPAANYTANVAAGTANATATANDVSSDVSVPGTANAVAATASAAGVTASVDIGPASLSALATAADAAAMASLSVMAQAATATGEAGNVFRISRDLMVHLGTPESGWYFGAVSPRWTVGAPAP